MRHYLRRNIVDYLRGGPADFEELMGAFHISEQLLDELLEGLLDEGLVFEPEMGAYQAL